jgi:glycogen debranching enzyme
MNASTMKLKKSIAHSCLLLMLIPLLSNCTQQKKEDVKNAAITFDLHRVPFSYHGAALALRFSNDKLAGQHGLTLTDISGHSDFGSGQMFRIECVHEDQVIQPFARANPARASILINNKEYARACFDRERIFRLRGSEWSLLLQMNNQLISENRLSVTPVSENEFQIQIDFKFGTSYYLLTALKGDITYDRKQNQLFIKPGANKSYEISLEETDSIWQTQGISGSFENSVTATKKHYEKWIARLPKVPLQYEQAKKLAAYILWSSVVNPGGYFKRPGMLMSKNWMHYIWSWDHCFNAMVCAYDLPEMAWNQFMILFDHQQPNGQLPDLIGRGRVLLDYQKPPVHGWSLRRIMNHVPLTEKQIKQAYEALSGWTNFWMLERDSNHNGLPEYTHGNDSGWDNGSEFDVNGESFHRGHFESANLAAFLVIQMDVLSDLAKRLGKDEAAQQWQQKSDQLLKRMLSTTWDGTKFTTINLDTGTENEKSQSLMAYLPLILGEKLPDEIRKQLINQLKTGGFLTSWGFATENPQSELYAADGYWKGPIWAPSTLIIVDGLEQCGEHALAKEVARSFCQMCAHNGFAENFNALTGEGLRDLSYTWTASVFLILAHEYLNN